MQSETAPLNDVTRTRASTLVDMAPTNLPSPLRRHLPVAQEAAERNTRALQASRGAELKVVMRDVVQIASHSTPAANRLHRIRYVAGRWSSLVSEHAACRKGCSHCCHVPVTMPRSEAKLIAKKIGTKLVTPPQAGPLSVELEEAALVYTGTPCPFLNAGSCSIYEDRPLVCRTLANMDDTDVLCELVPNVAVPVPYADNTYVRGLFVAITQHEDHADVREWFAHWEKR